MRLLLVTALLACSHDPPQPAGTGSGSSTVKPAEAPRAPPKRATARAAKIIDLAMSERLTCVARDDGHVRCWGYRYVGGDTPSSAVPVELFGFDHAVSIYLAVDGVVWVTNADGTVATTSVVELRSDTPLLRGVANVARTYYHYALTKTGAVIDLTTEEPIAGLEHVIAMVDGTSIDSSGRVWNGTHPTDVLDGARVFGPIVQRKTGALVTWTSGSMQPVTDLPATLTGFASAGTATCIIDGGAVKCRGDNRFGELGRRGAASKAFVRVALPAPATALAAGQRSFCAIAGGELYCWGANDGGQLGDGTLRDHDTPIHVVHATSAAPPAPNNGFDDAQTGPPFDWSGLPSDCKQPTDMIDETGKIYLPSVVSAYAFRDEVRTYVDFAELAMDPRGYQSSYSMAPTRGKQKAIELVLVRGAEHDYKPIDAGTYGRTVKNRSAQLSSLRGDYTSANIIGERYDLGVTVAHLDAKWICGTLTVGSDGGSTTHVFAARVVPPYRALTSP